MNKAENHGKGIGIQEHKFTRTISIRKLNTLPHLHIGPINPVVYRDPYKLAFGKSYLGTGLALRCFQRLSLPSIATRLYH